MAKAYRKAFELKRKEKNWELWLQGRYIYDVMCEVFPLYRFTTKKQSIKPSPYNAKPYPVTEEEMREREEQRRIKEMERMKAQFMEYATRLTIPKEERPTHEENAEVNADVNND